MIPIRFRLILKRHYFHLPRAGIVHYRSRPFASVRPSAFFPPDGRRCRFRGRQVACHGVSLDFRDACPHPCRPGMGIRSFPGSPGRDNPWFPRCPGVPGSAVGTVLGVNGDGSGRQLCRAEPSLLASGQLYPFTVPPQTPEFSLLHPPPERDPPSGPHPRTSAGPPA